eukprot:13105404-Alexandrium_andersonii.AAC.1
MCIRDRPAVPAPGKPDGGEGSSSEERLPVPGPGPKARAPDKGGNFRCQQARSPYQVRLPAWACANAWPT